MAGEVTVAAPSKQELPSPHTRTADRDGEAGSVCMEHALLLCRARFKISPPPLRLGAPSIPSSSLEYPRWGRSAAWASSLFPKMDRASHTTLFVLVIDGLYFFIAWTLVVFILGTRYCFNFGLFGVGRKVVFILHESHVKTREGRGN